MIFFSGLAVIKYDEVFVYNMEGKPVTHAANLGRESSLTEEVYLVLHCNFADQYLYCSFQKNSSRWSDGEECHLALVLKKKRLFFYPGNIVTLNSKTFIVLKRSYFLTD
jgi:hypothetical protein